VCAPAALRFDSPLAASCLQEQYLAHAVLLGWSHVLCQAIRHRQLLAQHAENRLHHTTRVAWQALRQHAVASKRAALQELSQGFDKQREEFASILVALRSSW
jgi:hypothetical protein